jgi:serine/threonine protein kinase
MHTFSLIHGDIKPVRSYPFNFLSNVFNHSSQPNVLIDDPPVARLTDFETTYSTSNTSGITRTATHASATEAYTAPEVELQQVDLNHPDLRSDIYSFALLVWHVRCSLFHYRGKNAKCACAGVHKSGSDRVRAQHRQAPPVDREFDWSRRGAACASVAPD